MREREEPRRTATLRYIPQFSTTARPKRDSRPLYRVEDGTMEREMRGGEQTGAGKAMRVAPAISSALRATRRVKYLGDEELHPQQAAVELADEFRSMARQLCPRDHSTQDDLAQEMALSALLCPGPHKRSVYRLLAAWRAHDYLRWWRQPVSREEAPGNAPEPTSEELDRFSAAINRLAGVA